MVARDRVVRWSLVSGVLLAVLAWHLVGPWASLVAVLLALGAAAVAYRIETPRIDLDHSDAWASDSADCSDTTRVDQ